MPEPLTFAQRLLLREYTRAYTLNYLYRLIPHFLGWIPYSIVWYSYFLHFANQLSDLKLENESLFDTIPDFVVPAVGATFVWFTTFSFVQIR